MTNLAAPYGVRVEPAPETAAAWRATSVRRLSGSENVGSRNVFVRVLQPNGDRDRNPNLRIGWTWEGRRPDELAPSAKLDKGDRNERGHGDVPINKFQKIAVWIDGDGVASDRVTGMHTGFVSDGPGNSWGHFSYEVIFQRAQGVVVVPPVVVEPEKPTVPDGVTKAEFWNAINAIQKQLDDMKALMQRWTGE